jgi:hypothetical protein
MDYRKRANYGLDIMDMDMHSHNPLYNYVYNLHSKETVFHNFTDCLYEMLSDINDNITNIGYAKIKIICDSYPLKKHDFVMDTLIMDEHYYVVSLFKNKKYNLYNDSDLYDFLMVYRTNTNQDINVTMLNSFKYLLNDIESLNNKKHHNFFDNKKSSVKESDIKVSKQSDIKVSKQSDKQKQILKELNKKPNSKYDDTNMFDSIKNLTQSINSKPLIEKVIFPEEMNIDSSDSYDSSYNEEGDSASESCDDNHSSQCSCYTKSVHEHCDDNHSSQCSCYTKSVGSNYINDIDAKIQKLEETKKLLDVTVDTVKKNLDEEDLNLSKFSCIVNQKKYKLKMDEDREQEGKNIFISEKEYTYPKIYNHFFIKKIIKSWDSVPPLFMIKFPIFVFLDGKNTSGENVRDKILNTPDEYRLYHLLYDSITNDDFEMPENADDEKLVCEFMETFPPIPILTSNDIMNSLNDSDDELFNEEETSQCSGDDKQDVGGNTTYG